MGKTIIEKIFSAKAGRDVAAGDLVVVPVDMVMCQDTKSAIGMEVLEKAGLPIKLDRDHILFAIDHRVPCSSELYANRHVTMRRFVEEHDFLLYDAGNGIGHMLATDLGYILPGYLALGTDSHSTTYGAINAAGIGIGSTELSVVLATGRLWFKVPKSMRITLSGSLPRGVYSKDVVLHLVGRLGEAGANYHSVELVGDAITAMSMEARFTVCNMLTDTGAKAAIMEADGVTRDWLSQRTDRPWEPVSPDVDALYTSRMEVDVSGLLPQVAMPHRVDNVAPIAEAVGKRIHQASIGSCTNARMEDLRIAAAMLKGRRVARGVRFYIVPGTKHIYRQAMQEGLLETFFEADAMVLVPSCATCSMGPRLAIPGDGEVIISAANRNFKGRMGNKNASIFLGSPATVTASAIAGAIADPREYV